MRYLIQTKYDVMQLMNLSSKVNLTFDTAHCVVAGDDCVDMIKTFADRIKYVHLKDYIGKLPAGDEYLPANFAEPGQSKGAIDFAAVLNELENIGYNGWITVELDGSAAKRPPLESAKMSREFLRNLGY
jgi:inosose dehydratase